MIPWMVVARPASPNAASLDLSSLRRMSGGGAAMPEAIATKLKETCGVTFVEGYGLTETMAPTHVNPPDLPKKQCLGIPFFDTDAMVVDPATLEELPQGEVGEIVCSGPQIFLGYWNKPQATAEAFFERDGRKYFRTGDLGRVDEEDYFVTVSGSFVVTVVRPHLITPTCSPGGFLESEDKVNTPPPWTPMPPAGGWKPTVASPEEHLTVKLVWLPDFTMRCTGVTVAVAAPVFIILATSAFMTSISAPISLHSARVKPSLSALYFSFPAFIWFSARLKVSI